MERLAVNSGEIIIPKVIIDGKTQYHEFYSITVTAYNLRNDTFQNGQVTALDVILTLGDLSLIEYELELVESIDFVYAVRSYWVSRINGETQVG